MELNKFTHNIRKSFPPETDMFLEIFQGEVLFHGYSIEPSQVYQELMLQQKEKFKWRFRKFIPFPRLIIPNDVTLGRHREILMPWTRTGHEQCDKSMVKGGKTQLLLYNKKWLDSVTVTLKVSLLKWNMYPIHGFQIQMAKI